MSIRRVLASLIVLLTACNLPVAPVQTTPGGVSVEISSPAGGSSLPAGQVVPVEFSATGGPFIEADLAVDDQPVDFVMPDASDPELTGTLHWNDPVAGTHVLKVSVLDANKNIASAEVSIQIAGGAVDLPSDSDMRVRFANLTEGGSVAAALDENGKPFVDVQIEVSGVAPWVVTLSADGVPVTGEARNDQKALPFTGEIKWYPIRGGGEYTLTANALTDEKQVAQASLRVIVTGVASFTPTPPPLDHAMAQTVLHGLFLQQYGIDVPAPSMLRFESPNRPDYSRWISSIYVDGLFHYVEIYDDTHFVQSGGPYSDLAHRLSGLGLVYCRPVGTYRVLVVFVDYGNLGVSKDQAFAPVAEVVAWVNGLYKNFAATQGLPEAPMKIQAEAAYVSPAPAPGELLTAAQIKSGSGVDPAGFDFIMQVDLDASNATGTKQWKGVVEQGGGIALQGCGAYYQGGVNIWSVVRDARDVRGVLVMDFNHELSHLFGMMDSWPFRKASLPDGTIVDDWIPYEMFGWTDTDGDGLFEILDPTPYGMVR